MTLHQRSQALVALGEHLRAEDELLLAHIKRSGFHNAWMTEDNYRRSIATIANSWLDAEALETWLADYPDLSDKQGSQKLVALVVSANLPLLAWHDVMSIFLAGHKAQIRLSEEDPFVLPYLLEVLGKIDARTLDYFELVSKLKGFDAVIAAGDGKSMHHFRSYFEKYPHIIRRSRKAVAILDGKETEEELLALGDDIFAYFGLGARNVSKLYVPLDYNFDALLTQLHEWRHLQHHTRYKNNFDYNYAKFLLNKEAFQSSGSIILSEDESIISHIAGLHYSYYDALPELADLLHSKSEEIELIVSRPGLLDLGSKAFGQAQQPSLADYLDDKDSMAWLAEL